MRGGLADEHDVSGIDENEGDTASGQHNENAEPGGSGHVNSGVSINARLSSPPLNSVSEVAQLDANVQDSATQDIPALNIGEPALIAPPVPAIHIPRRLLREDPESGAGFRSTPVQGANLGSPLPLDVARLRQQLDVHFDLNGTIDSGIGSSLDDSVQNADGNLPEITQAAPQTATNPLPEGFPELPAEEESYFNMGPRAGELSAAQMNETEVDGGDSLLRRGSRRISLATNNLWNRVHQMFPGGVVTTSESASRRSTIDQGLPSEILASTNAEGQQGFDNSANMRRFSILRNAVSRLGARANSNSMQQPEEQQDSTSEDEHLDMESTPAPAQSNRMRRALNRSISIFTGTDASAHTSQRGSVSTYGTGTMPTTPETQTPSTIRRTLSWLSIFPGIATTAPPSREGPVDQGNTSIGQDEGNAELDTGGKKGKAKPSLVMPGTNTLRLTRRLRNRKQEPSGASEGNASSSGAIHNVTSTSLPEHDHPATTNWSQLELTEERNGEETAPHCNNHDENITTDGVTRCAGFEDQAAERRGQDIEDASRPRRSLRRIGSHLHRASWGRNATKAARKVVHKQQNVLHR